MLRKATFGNSFSFSLKKVWTIQWTAQNFFQCKSCLFAEVSNRSHAGKAVAKFNHINYNYNLSKLSATFRISELTNPESLSSEAMKGLRGGGECRLGSCNVDGHAGVCVPTTGHLCACKTDEGQYGATLECYPI